MLLFFSGFIEITTFLFFFFVQHIYFHSVFLFKRLCRERKTEWTGKKCMYLPIGNNGNLFHCIKLKFNKNSRGHTCSHNDIVHCGIDTCVISLLITSPTSQESVLAARWLSRPRAFTPSIETSLLGSLNKNLTQIRRYASKREPTFVT